MINKNKIVVKIIELAPGEFNCAAAADSTDETISCDNHISRRSMIHGLRLHFKVCIDNNLTPSWTHYQTPSGKLVKIKPVTKEKCSECGIKRILPYTVTSGDDPTKRRICSKCDDKIFFSD
jgi:ribosomal protein S27AE